MFKYVAGLTLAEVNVEDYSLCKAGNSVDTHSSGSTWIPLTTPGTHYFICTVPDHCASGMKLAITVSAPGGSGTATPPCCTNPLIPPAGGFFIPQMVYSDAPGTLLSYGMLAIPFLVFAINQ